MYTIVDSVSGLVLFAKFDNNVLEGQTAIEQICTLENPDEKDVYYNFETKTFYI
jgi:hypothetical protein